MSRVYKNHFNSAIYKKAVLNVLLKISVVTALSVALAACGGDSTTPATSNTNSGQPASNTDSNTDSKNPVNPSPTPTQSKLSAAAQLGQRMFFDETLSASGQQSCATCHNPASGYAPHDDLPVQTGGPTLNLTGLRHTPGIGYVLTNTGFFFAKDGTPTGGFFWDGRAKSLQQQAEAPLLNPFEMANANKAEVVQRLAQAPYANAFKNLYGQDIFNNIDDAFDHLALAIQQYEREDPSFNSFSSKYDAFLRGQTQLNAQELRGLALFNNPQKGNCASCHTSAHGADGSMPLFTDFTYDNLGVPRNLVISANNDPQHYDLGLCKNGADDTLNRPDLCGAFKVPSLRNAALRHAFFHNGRFKTLQDVVTFYVQRDTNPEKWYPQNADGSVNKFDDLPRQYHQNVNVTEVPYNRKRGDAPALSDAEIVDVVAFINTLTDGYTPTP